MQQENDQNSSHIHVFWSGPPLFRQYILHYGFESRLRKPILHCKNAQAGSAQVP